MISKKPIARADNINTRRLTIRINEDDIGFTRKVMITIYTVIMASLFQPDNAPINAPTNANKEIRTAGENTTLGIRANTANIKLKLAITAPDFGNTLLLFAFMIGKHTPVLLGDF